MNSNRSGIEKVYIELKLRQKANYYFVLNAIEVPMRYSCTVLMFIIIT